MLRFRRMRVAALVVVAAGAGVALVDAGSGSGAPTSPAVAEFASVSSSPKSGLNIEIRSARTGAVTGVPWHLGESWTNNGFAFSPDGRYVYFTLIPKSRSLKSLMLVRLSVATRRAGFIAFGEQPAVSADGRLLAYASGEGRTATVTVSTLGAARRRSIDVERLLGAKSDVLNASLVWLGDGTHLALFEQCCAVAASTKGAQGGSNDSLHLIVISVAHDGRLSARRVALPSGMEMPESAGTDATRSDSVLVSALIAGDRAAVDRLTIGSARATLSREVAIPRALVVGFDPSGRNILYLVGHSGPNLWTASLRNHRLSQAHLLIRNPPLDAYAW